MIKIPVGWFFMGSETGQANERPVHRVWVDQFAIGKYPVTKREYEEFLATTNYPEPPFWRDPMFSNPQLPVVGVSWNDAIAFCRWSSEQ